MRAITAAFVAALLVAGSWRTARRAADWYDDVSLQGSALAVTPDDPRLMTSMARGLLQRGETQEARRLLDRALQIAPNHVPALTNLGWLLMQQGALAEAQAVFNRALAASPPKQPDAIVLNNLGVIALKQGDYLRARQMFQRALAVNPNYSGARQNLSSVERALGNAER
jgi:superkiller protein 3